MGMVTGATEHRLEVLLDTRAGALPGKSLVVLEPALGLATDIFLCEDGHAQERALLPEVLDTVEASDLWIGDRNFCTTEFIFNIESKEAFFLVRQLHFLPWTAETEMVGVGHTDGGEVFEQIGAIGYEGSSCRCRRVVVQLEHPTRDGETEIALLTNLPKKDREKRRRKSPNHLMTHAILMSPRLGCYPRKTNLGLHPTNETTERDSLAIARQF